MSQLLKARVGSVCIEETASGNLRIFMSHTPSNGMTIERADVDDLTVALDEILRHRPSPFPPREY